MLNVEKWAQSKNPAIAFFAINHAVIAREKSEALRNIKERCVYGHQFPLPDFPSWFAMYQSRKPIYAYKRLISDTSNFAKELMSFYSGLRMLDKELKRNPDLFKGLKITRQDFEEAWKFWQDMCSDTIQEIEEDIAKTPFDPEIQEKFRNALVKDELPLSFYFLVYAPCHLFYQMSPAALYRNALNSNISAIEKLLKLDPLILHDPAIGFQIQSVRLYGKENDYLDILSAIAKQPGINYKKISDERRSIKSDHGAQIYELTKKLNNPLDPAQIRDLYDTLASDYDGTITDKDIKKHEAFG
jgi:hypothetical protein